MAHGDTLQGLLHWASRASRAPGQLLDATTPRCACHRSLPPPQRIVVVNRSAAQDDKPERLHDSFSAVDYTNSR